MIYQLPTPMAMKVVNERIVDGQEWNGPIGNCMVIAWVDRHPDLHLIWLVIMDSTGECWEVENPFVRARTNLTWGRNAKRTPLPKAK